MMKESELLSFSLIFLKYTLKMKQCKFSNASYQELWHLKKNDEGKWRIWKFRHLLCLNLSKFNPTTLIENDLWKVRTKVMWNICESFAAIWPFPPCHKIFIASSKNQEKSEKWRCDFIFVGMKAKKSRETFEKETMKVLWHNIIKFKLLKMMNESERRECDLLKWRAERGMKHLKNKQ